MTEHTKEPWILSPNNCTIGTEDNITAVWTHDRADGERIVACVNALAGLKPEHVGELVEMAETVRHTSYYTDGDGEVWCTGCGHGLRNHDAGCAIGNLAALLAKVKVKK